MLSSDRSTVCNEMHKQCHDFSMLSQSGVSRRQSKMSATQVDELKSLTFTWEDIQQALQCQESNVNMTALATSLLENSANVEDKEETCSMQ